MSSLGNETRRCVFHQSSIHRTKWTVLQHRQWMSVDKPHQSQPERTHWRTLTASQQSVMTAGQKDPRLSSGWTTPTSTAVWSFQHCWQLGGPIQIFFLPVQFMHAAVWPTQFDQHHSLIIINTFLVGEIVVVWHGSLHWTTYFVVLSTVQQF